MSDALITQLNEYYRRYCESRDDRDPEEEYATDRGFAERHVGDFLDWLEEERTGQRPQPDFIVPQE